MNDKFKKEPIRMTGPATHIRNSTPSDSQDLADIPRWLTVDGSGVLKIDALDSGPADNPVTNTRSCRNTCLCSPKRIYATGTTATGIVGYW